MKTGKTFNDIRRLNMDIERKKKLEAERQKSLLMSEKSLLTDGAVTKKKAMSKNIKNKREKSVWGPVYPYRQILVSCLILIVAGIICTMILSYGNTKKSVKTVTETKIEKIYHPEGSITYRRVSGYVMNILKFPVKGKNVTEYGEIWHKNANPEVRYYSGLFLNELHDSECVNIRKIFQFEGYNCYYCVCGDDNEKRKEFVVKVAMENETPKLVSVE